MDETPELPGLPKEFYESVYACPDCETTPEEIEACQIHTAWAAGWFSAFWTLQQYLNGSDTQLAALIMAIK